MTEPSIERQKSITKYVRSSIGKIYHSTAKEESKVKNNFHKIKKHERTSTIPHRQKHLHSENKDRKSNLNADMRELETEKQVIPSTKGKEGTA